MIKRERFRWRFTREREQVSVLLFLALVIFFGQAEAEVLGSVDGIVYAQIGKELAARPFADWARLTWGGPFFEHPHLTPWLIGLSFKVFGVGTLSAILPALVVSVLTVGVTYLLGSILVGHAFGLAAGTVLTLTPQFVKDGRNPMLEPALMLAIMSAIYFHLRWWKSQRVLDSLGAGVFVGLAFLAKGPPGALAWASVAVISILFSKRRAGFPISSQNDRGATLVHVAMLGLIPLAMLALIDLWHGALTGQSFFAQYGLNQLKSTVVEARGAPGNDVGFYLRIVARYFPWLPFAIASFALVLRQKDKKPLPALMVGATVVLGTLLGFTVMRHKGPWYTAIYHSGFALLSATTLYYLIRQKEERFVKHYSRWVLSLVVPLLFLSASFPSLFTSYPREHEQFLEHARAQVGDRYLGQKAADCVQVVNDWKGPFFIRFYLGAQRVACGDSGADVKIVDLRSYRLSEGETYVFSMLGLALVQGAKAR